MGQKVTGVPCVLGGVSYPSWMSAARANGVSYNSFKSRIQKGASPQEAMDGLLIKKMRVQGIVGPNCDKLPLQPYKPWPSKL